MVNKESKKKKMLLQLLLQKY